MKDVLVIDDTRAGLAVVRMEGKVVFQKEGTVWVSSETRQEQGQKQQIV